MFFKFCGRNPEKSRDQILKIYGEIIIFRVFTAKIAFLWNSLYLSEKYNFHRGHPNYDNFYHHYKIPHDSLHRFQFEKKNLSEKFCLAENTLYMISDQKIISTEILKNDQLLTPKGHLGSN